METACSFVCFFSFVTGPKHPCTFLYILVWVLWHRPLVYTLVWHASKSVHMRRLEVPKNYNSVFPLLIYDIIACGISPLLFHLGLRKDWSLNHDVSQVCWEQENSKSEKNFPLPHTHVTGLSRVCLRLCHYACSPARWHFSALAEHLPLKSFISFCPF